MTAGGEEEVPPPPIPDPGVPWRRRAAALGAVLLALATGAVGAFLAIVVFSVLVIALGADVPAFEKRSDPAWWRTWPWLLLAHATLQCLAAGAARWVGDRCHERLGGAPRRRSTRPVPLARRLDYGLRAWMAGSAAGVGTVWAGFLLAGVKEASPAPLLLLFLLFFSAPTLGILVARAVQRRAAPPEPPPSAMAGTIGTPSPAPSRAPRDRVEADPPNASAGVTP
ncbi:MAG: hypothetical protein L6R43_19490 [Planctomycetes bacterium]|nr:hypothetical protein [Planctomycetota bacterium]